MYYAKTHNIRDIELFEVTKSLNCYGYDNGRFVYSCKKCGSWVFQSLGCNSRICSSCGKRHADNWALNLSKRMFKVPHRHIVLSIASELWPYLKDNWPLKKVYMDSAIDALNDYLPKIIGDASIKVGAIVFLHTFGKDMKEQPHLHLIITEGGFNSKNEFVNKVYIRAEGFAECWRYHVCKNLNKAGIPFEVTNWCFHNKRFYVWVHKDGRISHPKQIAQYLGRYIRHPAIANSRIDFFDKIKLLVGFHYFDHKNNRHDVVMSTDDFISALIKHIPPKNFKLVRYYGVYARRARTKYKSHLQSSIEQTKLTIYGVEAPEKILTCPYCGGELRFVMYCTKPPPEIPKPQREMTNWISVNS